MNRVWKTLWPECGKGEEEADVLEFEDLPTETTMLTNTVGFEEAIKENFQKLVLYSKFTRARINPKMVMHTLYACLVCHSSLFC